MKWLARVLILIVTCLCADLIAGAGEPKPNYINDYFDKNIWSLTKLPSGKVDPTARGLEDNDADAFRHAYVSGVFTQVYGEATADIFGRLNELDPASIYSNSQNPNSKNMDLWNNSVGRKYGKKTNSRKVLLKKIHEALKKGELI